jgi:hypothetical protein
MSENAEIYLIAGVIAAMLILGVIALVELTKDEVSKEDAK